MPSPDHHSYGLQPTRFMPTYITIPMKDRLDLTESLVLQLEKYRDSYNEILLFDNGSSERTLGILRDWESAWRVRLFERPAAGIYQMWNEAWDWCSAKHTKANLAILNNDIVIPDRFIQRLARKLRDFDDVGVVYPDYSASVSELSSASGLLYTHGTYRHGGMSGWAFMVKTEMRSNGVPPIDDQFVWWAGDDDLAFAVEAAGYRQARVQGLSVEHLGGATPLSEELDNVRLDDLKRCQAKWGR
jgi:glycosyltransferase involved in cell wall biosynthesis